MFSVVIPTHNRLDLLRDAVETVLRQDHADWELIIFDNASMDDIGGYVDRISDRRIRYERSDEFLPVTDSWNRAIDLATGCYVTLLGDDDGLTPDYFAKLSRIIDEFDSPEVLYSAIYQFLHPGVAPWERRGYVADVKNGFFFVGRQTPFMLPKEEARKAVRGSLSLRRNFTFNMQAFCFNRTLLQRLRKDGPVFRSPFPDYYLANIAFAKAQTVVVISEPMAIAGVSKASYGYTLFNGLEDKGNEILNAKLTSDSLYGAVEKFLLPGPSYNTNYVVTMEHVSRYAKDFVNSGVAFGRYRRLQIFRVLSANEGRRGRNTPIGSMLWSRLTLAERLWTLALSQAMKVCMRQGLYDRWVAQKLGRLLEPYDYVPPVKIYSRGGFSQLIQVFAALQSGIQGKIAVPAIPLPAQNGPALSETSTESHPQNDRIAVVYLARMAEGIAPLRKFVESYVRHPAGTTHELVVIYKGFEKESDLNVAKSVFASLPHISLEISDEGFDINAYLKAAGEIEHDYGCFLNTYSEIASPDWLSILYKYASLPDVGIVGAMGSYESLHDSFALINKVIWLCNEKRIAYDRQLEYFYSFIIDPHCMLWKKMGKHQVISTARAVASYTKRALLLFKTRDYVGVLGLLSRERGSIDEEFRRIWEGLVSPDGTMTDYLRFPKFPNPHIRSDAFMISRKRFLGLLGRNIETKLDACAFESGFDSMTRQLRRMSLRPVVVNRFGQGYDIADWVRSGTFRLGNQDGLIVQDNQSRAFDNMTPGAQASHVRMTWGDYLGEAPPDRPDLNFKFSINPLISSLGEAPPDRPDLDFKFSINPLISSQSCKFSFLIPSKNRLQLLRLAVDSILRQEYENFEIIIADNASDEDYFGFVDKIRDERIVYRRVSEPISVTENWRRALEMATGDYVLMLGDDDALAPGCVKGLAELINMVGNPDIVYMAAYHYCYPNVIPGSDKGYLADVRNSMFFKDREGPFRLPLEQAQSVARAACDFRYEFGFNSQHFLFRAGFLQNFSAIGGIFQGPYPDTFAAVVSFLTAKSIVAVPEPKVIIGISPKSFGYYYFNDKQSEGYEFLDNAKVSVDVRDSIKDVLLPGDGNNTNWLIAVEAARRALAPDIRPTINIERYRILQMVAFLRSIYIKGVRQQSESKQFITMLTQSESLIFGILHAGVEVAHASSLDLVNRYFELIEQQLGQFWPAQVTMIDIGEHADISDAFNWLATKHAENVVDAAASS